MNSGVYKLVWENSPAYYIGSSKSFHKRLSAHWVPRLEIIAICNPTNAVLIEHALISHSSKDAISSGECSEDVMTAINSFYAAKAKAKRENEKELAEALMSQFRS